MEEILKNIADEINFIKEQQNKLDILTQNSKEVFDEFKNLQQEQSTFVDKESGFYKDLQEKVDEKEKEFRQVDIERMNKDREINKLILEKKKSIIESLEEKKKYIDDNRNVNISEKLEEAKELEIRKKELEAVIERDRKNGLPDNDKIQEFRKKRIDDLNLKLEEINSFDKLLSGQAPKEKFMEIESLIKMVEDNFDKNGLDKILGYKGISQEKLDKQEQEIEEDKAEQEIEEDKTEKQEDKTIKENEEFDKSKNKRNERNINDPRTIETPKNVITRKNRRDVQKTKITLKVDKNKLDINDDGDLFYKEAKKYGKKSRKELDKNNVFLGNKKGMKNLDYALLYAIKEVNSDLVQDYLNVIKGRAFGAKNYEESIKRLKDSLDIEYIFDEKRNQFSGLKEKRVARNAKKIGIASLEGISEKSIFDTIKEKISKIKDIKLLNGKKDTKALASGENTRAKQQKQKTIDLINKDREAEGVRSRVKVENKDNIIEKNAQKQQKAVQEQLGKEVSQIIQDDNKNKSR